MEPNIQFKVWSIYLADGIGESVPVSTWMIKIDAEWECGRLRAATGLPYVIESLDVSMYPGNPYNLR